PKRWEKRELEAMAVNKITWNEIKNAPSLKTVLKKFEATFGTDVTVTPYGSILDTAYLRMSYKECKMKYPFDYHVFDIWPLAFIYMAKHKLLTNKTRFSGFSMEDTANHFNIPVPEDRHTVIADCRLEAEILRRLLKELV
ncbi:MAG: exonuclease domain-containing protein, partial [bacterium]|nr:exonuclease domain-containing protein [bacterium]